MAKPAVRRTGGSSGGDELVVDAPSSGKIKVIALGGAGGIVGSGGSRAAHIADRAATTVTAGAVLATKFNPQLASFASGINSIVTALRNIGVLATS